MTTWLLYRLVAGHMIYEQACRTPWQHLLAHSAASVKVRVSLPLLCACFALLFHWKWCPSGVVRMLSSFWMWMRNLRVFGIYDIPIATIKLNAIMQCWNWWGTIKEECGWWKCGCSAKEDKKHKKRVPARVTKIEKSKKSEAVADDVYQPKLVWFQRADISLKNVVSSRTTTLNLISTFFLLNNFSYFYYIHLYINVKLLTLVLIIKDYTGLHQ